MSEHKYTSLSDLLKGQPPKIGHRTRNDDEEIPLVTDFFGELYFRESSSSSSSLAYRNFSPPLPLPKVSPNQNITRESNGGPENDDFSYQNKTIDHVKEENLAQKDSCMYNNSLKLFPPPISTLKKSKTGEPFTYQRFDEKTSSFVTEEIMLLPQGVGLMCASRENGRLRMRFAHGQEEDGKDEKAAMEAVSDDDDGEKSDEGKQD